MKNHNVDTIEYDNLYTFIMYSESEIDFIERSQIVSVVIINELANRISKVNAMFPIQLVGLIDKMNEEVLCLTTNINQSKVIDNQPPIMNPLLLRLIQVNNSKLFHDYINAKTILPN
jgi:hypothetical protein